MSQETHDDQITHTGDCDGPEHEHVYNEQCKAIMVEYHDLLNRLDVSCREELEQLKARIDALIIPFNLNPAWTMLMMVLREKRTTEERSRDLLKQALDELRLTEGSVKLRDRIIDHLGEFTL